MAEIAITPLRKELKIPKPKRFNAVDRMLSSTKGDKSSRSSDQKSASARPLSEAKACLAKPHPMSPWRAVSNRDMKAAPSTPTINDLRNNCRRKNMRKRRFAKVIVRSV